MPVGAQGSAFKLLTKQETTEGTLATGNYQQLPCYTFDLAGSQELQGDQILSAGNGRDATDPYLDVLMVQGNARVPVDLVNIGVWLKLLLGAPTSSGTTNFTHAFKSGSIALPTNSFEKAFPDKSLFEQFTGVRGNTLQIDFSPGGAADATIGLMGLGAPAPTGVTAGGTPTIATGFTRFQKSQGGISKDGSALASVTQGSVNFSNNLEGVRTIRADNRMEGVDIGQSTAEGNLTIRLNDASLITQAVNNTPSALAFSYTIDANKSLLIELPRCFLSRPGIAVQGPNGIDLPVRFRAAYDPTATCLLRATLKNQQASY